MENGRITVQQVDPAELSPGEFVHAVRQAVDKHHAAIVVIDSLNGYLAAMPSERYLVIQLHELLTYLGQCGVATLMVGAHQGLIGMQMSAPVDASYLADAILLLRYFEDRGRIREAISVIKKRGGEHERNIREFSLSNGRVEIGEPLDGFRGVLTGIPTLEGQTESLAREKRK
jgi:circadian clock protein KaiC